MHELKHTIILISANVQVWRNLKAFSFYADGQNMGEKFAKVYTSLRLDYSN